MEEANDSSLAAAAEGRAMAAVTAFSDSLLGTSARLERPQVRFRLCKTPPLPVNAVDCLLAFGLFVVVFVS